MTVFSIAQLFLFSACQDDDTLLTKQDEQVLMEKKLWQDVFRSPPVN